MRPETTEVEREQQQNNKWNHTKKKKYGKIIAIWFWGKIMQSYIQAHKPGFITIYI